MVVAIYIHISGPCFALFITIPPFGAKLRQLEQCWGLERKCFISVSVGFMQTFTSNKFAINLINLFNVLVSIYNAYVCL